jgi:DinB family protein
MPSSPQIQSVIDDLARGPALVRQLIYDMPPELRKRRPAPGVWSAHEHAVHLPAIYPLINRRLDLMLTDPDPYIKGYEPSRDDQDGALLKLDLDTEMDRFERERVLLIDRIRTLTPAQWEITAGHEEYTRYGVFIMFRHIALHDLHHAYKIEDRLLRKAWD